MLNYLKGFSGSIKVNEVIYDSVEQAIKALGDYHGEIHVVIGNNAQNANMEVIEQSMSQEVLYRIQVRQYMTKPASAEFDFHTKWNNDQPMPLRIMVGRKLQETKGLVKMELWGDITSEITPICMKCGRPLTNPVSQYFGIGPECGGHNYTNPFESDEALHQAVDAYKLQLQEIKWTGWIVKSAIEEQTQIKGETKHGNN